MKHRIFWLTAFAVAMGFLETSVVVYLRRIYYPDGFRFPIRPIDADLALTEFLREAATVVMLAAVGVLTGKTRLQRFSGFVYCFAVWDIFYYIFLKLLLGWPQSLLTWDLLFLIPVPWLGPVLAPCLVSAAMIAFFFVSERITARYPNAILRRNDAGWMLAGALIILASFVAYPWKELATGFVPVHYSWIAFSAGFGLMIFGTYRMARRAQQPLR